MVYYIPEFLVKQQELHDAQYWRVYDGNNLLSKQESNVGVNKSIELLQEFLDETNGDYVTVKLYQNKPELKTEGVKFNNPFVYRVSLRNQNKSNTGISAPVSNSFNPSFQDLQILNERIHQMEIEKIRAEYENEDVEPSYQDLIMKQVFESGFIGQISNFMGAKLFGANILPVNSSVNNDGISGSSADEKLKELQIGEKEKLVLAEFLKTNPDYLKMIIEAAKK